MIAGPHQKDRTLIELYANKMSTDPASAAELFAESAEVHPGGLAPLNLQGRPQILGYLSQAQQKLTYKVINHLPRQGDDNYAEISADGAGTGGRIHTIRFRTDGYSITQLEMVGTRKA